MKKIALVAAVLLGSSTLGAGCKSDEDKCREAALTTYDKVLADCKDDACKKDLANKPQWVENFVKMCK